MISDVFKFKGSKSPKIKSLNNDEILKFDYNKDDLKDPDVFERFIKSCENNVRKDPRYKNYINHLKTLGFNQCTFMSKVTGDMAKIEMHHGPIFNLYDLCAIVTDSLLSMDEKVNTLGIARIILDEHEANQIQVTMLSVTAHQLYHAGKLFIHYKQSIGDCMGFIKRYKKGIKKEHLYTSKKYLDMCIDNDSTDNDFLQVMKKLKKHSD
jgi:hypothetical protein